MFRIKDKTIHLTRGDIACIDVKVKNNDGTDHTFVIGDIIRFKVFKRKDCSKVEIQKDVVVAEETNSVNVFLTGEETKIGEIINKPVIYWYEVELNPDTHPQTIIGYDENGERQLILYPEGSDK